MRCRGCLNGFHPGCLAPEEKPAATASGEKDGEEERWRCPDCLAGIHPCFLCKLSEGETVPASPGQVWGPGRSVCESFLIGLWECGSLHVNRCVESSPPCRKITEMYKAFFPDIFSCLSWPGMGGVWSDLVFLELHFFCSLKIRDPDGARAQSDELTRGPRLVSSALSFIRGVHIGARALHVLNLIWVWLNRSPIPVGRKRVISSFKLFLA